MAKAKIVEKNFPIQLRLVAWKGEEYGKWENFKKALAIRTFTEGHPLGKAFHLDAVSHSLIIQPIQTADEIIEILKEEAENHDIEIEFEEKKEEKWRPVHGIFLEKPNLSAANHMPTIAFLYAKKAKAPKEAIPELLKFFEKQLRTRELHRPYSTYTYENIEKAIRNLKQQQKESE